MIVPPTRGLRVWLLGAWRRARPAQRLAYAVGGVLILAGVAHLAAWLLVGGAWAGPVSFRKPTTFGVSFGLTTITLAWITGRLRIGDRAGWLLLGPWPPPTPTRSPGCRCSAGAASPPTSTSPPPWTAGCSCSGAAIAVTAAVIVALTVLAFTAIQAPAPMALAIRAGLGILLVAQGVGGWMIQHGVGPAGEGVTEGLTTFGAAGVMKVPHAVAMHAIQVLPLLAWLLSFTALAERRRLALVWMATLGYAGLVVVSLLQTAAGLAPFDLGAVAAAVFLLGVGLLAAAFLAALFALRASGSRPAGIRPAATDRSGRPA